MKTYAFELSGEHGTLPKEEALALLELYSSGFREVRCPDQCLIVEAEDLDSQPLGKRLAMTHRIIEVLAICGPDPESLSEAVGRIELPQKRYRVRARRIKDAALRADEAEREVGSSLFRRGFKADLENPEVELRAIITEGEIILGLEVACTDRSSFEARRPHLKPFFHPGVLMPRMARALVNLSKVRVGERMLDPFAGTGGILVEACLIGVKGVGVEVQPRLARGALCNLKGLDCSIISGDAKRLPFEDISLDGAVLDTPYGRSAKIEAKSKDVLLSESLSELHRVLRPERHMVIVADRPIDTFVTEAGFEILQWHTDRVHRSLTRQIFVCSKVG